MEFIIGIYDVDRSGDTDKMSMRGSGSTAGLSAGLLEVDGCEIRFISISVQKFVDDGWSRITYSTGLL